MYKNLKKHMKDKKIFQWDLAVLLELSESRVRYRFSKQSFKTVSYTHLTLPTTYTV